MLETRPSFLSLTETLFPEAARGIARMISLYLGLSVGKPGKYSKSGGEEEGSWTTCASADDWERKRRLKVVYTIRRRSGVHIDGEER